MGPADLFRDVGADAMMIGSYPCCEGDLWIPMPERTPAYAPEACPHCGAKVWHRFSRLEPKSCPVA